jgi:RNA polymerase sigma factor (sigma-70 family)
VQDVFIRVIKAAHTFDPGKASFLTWVYRIARNRCIDVSRHRKRFRWLPLTRNSEQGVFLLTPAQALVQLIPDPVYSPSKNPLRAGQEYYLPAEPNWFYPTGDMGQGYLYVVASPLSLQGLEDAYTRYSQAEDGIQKQELLTCLFDTLESSRNAWMFAFDYR